jgi:hypothetical protein
LSSLKLSVTRLLFLAKPTFLTKNRNTSLPSYPLRNLVGRLEKPLSLPPFLMMILSLLFVFSLAVYPGITLQGVELDATSSLMFNPISIPDFSLDASSSTTVLADGTTPATSTIIVNPLDGFIGTVALSNLPLPADLVCTGITPAKISYGSGQATLSCTSIVTRAYAVTIIGVSGGIRHNATATFTFAASTSPDFTIATSISPVSLTSGSTAVSTVTLSSLGGFDSQVNLTVNIYPSMGLSVSLNPQSFINGSGKSTAIFSASAPGDYTVTITGTSGSLSHTTTTIVAATLAGPPDFRISASTASVNVGEGNSGTIRITITPYNGFAGSIALAISAPAGVSCNLSPTIVQSSGESTLTCNGRIPGDYTITIKATGGAGSHTTAVDVHVAAVSPASPAPSPIRGFPAVFTYGIIGVIIMVFVAGGVLVLRRSRQSKS